MLGLEAKRQSESDWQSETDGNGDAGNKTWAYLCQKTYGRGEGRGMRATEAIRQSSTGHGGPFMLTIKGRKGGPSVAHIKFPINCSASIKDFGSREGGRTFP